MEQDFKDLGVRTPYTVPEGFFGEMHDRLAAIPAQQRRRRRVVALRWLSAAAALVLVAGSSFLLTRKVREDRIMAQFKTQEDIVSGLTDEEIDAWVAFSENDIFLNVMAENQSF